MAADVGHAADDAHIKRERAKAKELKASQWWRQQIGPGVCRHCGRKFPKTELTMDHLIPVSRGGKSTKANVVPSCRPCNQTRGHKLDVERRIEQMGAKQIWLDEDHRLLLGQSFENLNCFGVSKYYFAKHGNVGLTADEMLTWVASHFVQIELSAEFVEPILVLVWLRKSSTPPTDRPVAVTGKSAAAKESAAPNVYELGKRRPGFPFGWVMEHSFVVVSSLADVIEEAKTGFAELEEVLAYHKVSPRPEDAVRVEPVKEVLRIARVLPGFALTFHAPIQHR